MEVESKDELMGLLSELILPSFRESPFTDFQHCPSTRDTLGEVQSSVLSRHVFRGAKGKDHMCPIHPSSLSFPCRLSTEGAAHVELGMQSVQQQILSYQEVLTPDMVSLNGNCSQPIKDI